MIWGRWRTASLAYATDDDLTPSVDLEKDFEFCTVAIPTIESSTVTLHVSRDDTTFYPVYAFDADASGDFAHATTGATTSHVAVFRIGGFRYVKVSFGTGQTANRSILVRGFSRG